MRYVQEEGDEDRAMAILQETDRLIGEVLEGTYGPQRKQTHLLYELVLKVGQNQDPSYSFEIILKRLKIMINQLAFLMNFKKRMSR